jgi:hypothetical protein
MNRSSRERADRSERPPDRNLSCANEEDTSSRLVQAASLGQSPANGRIFRVRRDYHGRFAAVILGQSGSIGGLGLVLGEQADSLRFFDKTPSALFVRALEGRSVLLSRNRRFSSHPNLSRRIEN